MKKQWANGNFNNNSNNNQQQNTNQFHQQQNHGVGKQNKKQWNDGNRAGPNPQAGGAAGGGGGGAPGGYKGKNFKPNFQKGGMGRN